MPPIFLGIIQSISLLMSMCLVYALLYPYLRQQTVKQQCITGAMFGGFCVLSMLLPFQYAPGIYFDSRSIIISLAAFFGGAIPAVITAAMAIAYRCYKAGQGMLMGISVIMASAGVGMLFYRLRQKKPILTQPLFLYLFGVLVHGIMVTLMFLLPAPHRVVTFQALFLPVMTLYPLGTLLIGGVFARLELIANLQKELKLLASAVENATDHIVITDAHGTILYVNTATSRSSGVPKEAIIGQNLFFPPVKASAPQELLEEIWTTVSSGRVWSGRLSNRTRSGTDMLLEAVITPIKNREGDIVNYVSVSRNRTREQQLEQQLMQAQKMEALGTLAGGIAHDFNNILAGITGYIEIAQSELPVESPLQHHLDKVLSLGDRAAHLVRQILAFSRKTKGDRKPIDLTMVVQEAIQLLRATTPSFIEIRERSDGHPHTVLADATQMQQIIMNLCTNAVHALQESGGILEVLLSRVELNADDASTYYGLDAGKYVQLKVSDTGQGIAPDIRDKIFDPFFTTKEVGKGTGLGLAVVHGIVKEHGGAIYVQSTPGKGTTFTVLLPLWENAHIAPSVAEETETDNLYGSERILLVDDEHFLLDAFKKRLTRLGYKIITAENGADAWQLFSQTPEAFDLVITDYAMPEMTGIELAKKILKIRPTLPIILCTGYADSVTPEKAEAAGVAAILEKPVSLKTLAHRMRELLPAHPAKADGRQAL